VSESAKERADRILSEALYDTDIDEGRTSYTWNEYFQGRVEVYWKRQADYPGIDLILDSEGGQVQSVVDLDCLSQNIAELFPDDDEAAMAWQDVFHYLLDALDPLPYVNNSLTRRSITLQPEGKETEEAKMLYAEHIEPVNEALERRRRALAAQLRGSFRRGGSPPRVPVSDQQCALIATEYPVLAEHWRTIKRWRREHPNNWRDHATIELKETPNDLLDRLDGKAPKGSNEDYPGIPAVLALEHAARRAGLPANAYSYSNLKILRSRGKRISQMNKRRLI
jgi:hypothetical protein